MTDIRVHLPPRPAPSDGTDWRDHAACRDADPELFFPIGNAGPALHQVDQAKQVCARCTVRTPCLEWALASGQESGVWGGTSDDERRALRRMRRSDARPDATDPRRARDLDSKPKRHDRMAGREDLNEAVT
jgi:WhiB family transcriptional regulator, redox-sensing transcriptional regulator